MEMIENINQLLDSTREVLPLRGNGCIGRLASSTFPLNGVKFSLVQENKIVNNFSFFQTI